MGTEVLRPQDYLIERIRIAPAVLHNRRKNEKHKTNNQSGYRKPVVRQEKMTDQKKRFNYSPEPMISKRSSSADGFNLNNNNNNPVMGKVTILRRGQSLDSFDSKIKSEKMTPLKKSGDDLAVYGTGRLGPDPGMVPKQIRLSPVAGNGLSGGVYAGSAFSMSPSPRSLPLPSFFYKKQAVEDSATRDLRRLLRLE
ncbi:unnamed protein product [Ilex paraguariensis]|uniref:Uncharacterized protein n=1 Tax=Ilex paraguariensis TaxID=185542 RepID=A0ABC8UIM5_9AQUA